MYISIYVFLVLFFSIAYVLYWNFNGFKIFFIYCVFKRFSCSTKMFWNHPFSYCFLSVTVKIHRILNCFVFVRKNILLCSQNYNSKFLSTKAIHLHKLKLIYWRLSYSRKILICKNIYILCAFTLIKSHEILF